MGTSRTRLLRRLRAKHFRLLLLTILLVYLLFLLSLLYEILRVYRPSVVHNAINVFRRRRRRRRRFYHRFLTIAARNGGEGVTYFGGGIRAGGGGAPPLALAFVVVVVVAVDDFSVVLFPADGVAFPPYDIARSLSLFFHATRSPPRLFLSSNAESLLSFPSLSFSFFLSLSRERETNNATPTTNFVRSFSFRRCSKRASIQLITRNNKLSSLSSSSRNSRVTHKTPTPPQTKKCRRPVRRRLRRAEHSRFGSSSTFIPKGALKKDQKRVRWFRKDSSLLLCGKEREREREREKEEQKKIGIFCVTIETLNLREAKKNAKVKPLSLAALSYSVFLSFFLSFFLSMFGRRRRRRRRRRRSTCATTLFAGSAATS